MTEKPQPTIEQVILLANKNGYRVLNLFQVPAQYGQRKVDDPEARPEVEWRWRANVRKRGVAYHFGEAETPVKALLLALQRARNKEAFKALEPDSNTPRIQPQSYAERRKFNKDFDKEVENND